MQFFNKPSFFLKIIILLQVMSLLWFCAVMELMYNILFQEFDSKLLILDYSTQLKIVYILGVIIVTSYSVLILITHNNENNHHFN